jgi:hypothetical protein
METGLEFVANARRQLIRLIAFTIVVSSCAALLLIAILMIITGNVAGLASYPHSAPNWSPDSIFPRWGRGDEGFGDVPV